MLGICCLAALTLAVEKSAVTDIAIETAKSEVYAQIGVPESAAAIGKKAVLRYYKYILYDGFILIY